MATDARFGLTDVSSRALASPRTAAARGGGTGRVLPPISNRPVDHRGGRLLRSAGRAGLHDRVGGDPVVPIAGADGGRIWTGAQIGRPQCETAAWLVRHHSGHVMVAREVAARCRTRARARRRSRDSLWGSAATHPLRRALSDRASSESAGTRSQPAPLPLRHDGASIRVVFGETFEAEELREHDSARRGVPLGHESSRQPRCWRRPGGCWCRTNPATLGPTRRAGGSALFAASRAPENPCETGALPMQRRPLTETHEALGSGDSNRAPAS